MPKFLYTIILLAIIFGTLLARQIFLVNPLPEGNMDVNATLIFFLLLFLTANTLLSLPIYFILHARAPTFSNLRFLYRKALRWSTFLSFGAVFYLGLVAFKLNTIINVFLFLVMYVLIFLQLRSSR